MKHPNFQRVSMRQTYRACYSFIREYFSLMDCADYFPKYSIQHDLLKAKANDVKYHLDTCFSIEMQALCMNHRHDFQKELDPYKNYAWLYRRTFLLGWSWPRTYEAIRKLKAIAAPEGIPF